MVLSRAAPLTQLAAAPMLASIFLQCVAVFMLPVDPDGPVSPMTYLIRVLPSIMAAAGPVIQYLQASRDPAVFAPRPSRPFSALPYIAITVTSGALIATLPPSSGAAGCGGS